MVVVYDATLPPGLNNTRRTNATYQNTDACGIKTTHTSSTITGEDAGGVVQEFWCSWWSKERAGWVTDGCHVTNVVLGTSSSTPASNETNRTNTTTVSCKCSIVLPADTKDTSFEGDFSLITSYAFSRVASTFERDTPFEVSSAVLLLCCVPTAVFFLLLLAYRFIPHRIFSYQRGGNMSRAARKAWCVVCACVVVVVKVVVVVVVVVVVGVVVVLLVSFGYQICRTRPFCYCQPPSYVYKCIPYLPSPVIILGTPLGQVPAKVSAKKERKEDDQRIHCSRDRAYTPVPSLHLRAF